MTGYLLLTLILLLILVLDVLLRRQYRRRIETLEGEALRAASRAASAERRIAAVEGKLR